MNKSAGLKIVVSTHRIGRRRALRALATGALGVAIWPQAAMAARTWRIGLLDIHSRGGEGEFARPFVKAMAKLGYVEGKNIVYEYQYADLDLARITPLAAEMVRSKPDAIVAPGTPFTTALLRETSSIPIVTTLGDPVGSGFAKSLARPGGNVTGLSLAYPESARKTFEMLKSIIPGQWKLALVETEGDDHFRFSGRVMEEAARQNGVPSVWMSVKDKGEAERAFASMRSQGIRVVVVMTLVPGYDESKGIALATASGLATVSNSDKDVELGALLAYETRQTDSEGRMADQLDKILRGTPPGEIPFELPTAFHLSINLKTARALGLTIPRELMLRTDKVYE